MCTLYEAQQLVECLTKRSCLEPYAVRLKKIRSSSVAITLACSPVALELLILALDRDFLKSHQIVSVMIDDKPLEEYSGEYVKVCVLTHV